ncbi:coenzyme F420 hydrogenase [Motilibacter sp. E257]|uniref:Coenzyme F420 hydrogenase n=2 Tax=Motilibacter deserti TaxID=2714956 RepID=A0ABX0GXJ4_9ACTN|nr:Coenzyme F420 hydrogenase/dehydrogenase, beta subunit C-terminal domain [Motilibacter deserti]NHC14415.1 coenzyme F420 hydrogenase [Motilibacter deserti]
MVDDLAAGRRPLQLLPSGSPSTQAALRACPGAALAHDPGSVPAGADPGLLPGWGPVLEVWEGYAGDPELRFAGSSGGAASALALHLVGSGGAAGVIHTAARADAPLLNETVVSTTREELLARAGSRYAPASPADGLGTAERAGAVGSSPYVFIGKPCDVAGAAKATAVRPALQAGLALTIGVFCAGTPSTAGTLELVRAMGFADPSDVESVRYRGNGWPGEAVATGTRDGEFHEARFSYADSWGAILQRHRQWRCHVCLDHTGEFADVAVGDPWYREIEPGEPGRSLVVVRTERGRQAVAAARASGALVLERVGNDVLPRSQPNLVRTRGAVWGRITTMRLLGLPAPRYAHMPAFRSWLRDLTPREKASSFVGTARRIRARRMRRPAVVVEHAAPRERSDAS